jgi:hypothetical protein
MIKLIKIALLLIAEEVGKKELPFFFQFSFLSAIKKQKEQIYKDPPEWFIN